MEKIRFSGYDIITKEVDKLQGGELVLISSRPALGKTTFSLSLAEHLTKKNHNICFFSLEMSKNKLEERITENSFNISSSNFDIIDKPNLTITELVDIVKNKTKNNNIKYVFIDYLELLVTNDYEQKTIETLKSLALDMNITFFVLIQINKKLASQKPERNHFNISENVADFIIALDNNNEKMETELLIIK